VPRSFALAAGTFSAVDDLVATFAGRATFTAVDVADADALPRLLDGVDGLLVGLQPVTAQHVTALPSSVRVIGRAGIGLDSIDLEAAAGHGVTVVHQPDYATTDVADHAAALILALNRRILAGDAAARSAWPSLERFADITPLEECILGVAGCGRIGRAVIERLRPFVGAIVAYDPEAASLPAGVTRASSFIELLERGDIVTLHMPLEPGTRNIVNAATLARMKPSSLLVNVSRGGLIDEDALARALHAGQLAGAAVDVLAEEPPPADHPLLSAPRTIVTPHVAWLSARGQSRLKTRTTEAMLDVLDGRRPSYGRVAVDGSRAPIASGEGR
jgi:D-3-phosphoglycerate dehydrogenase